jgi:hypothetical protein
MLLSRMDTDGVSAAGKAVEASSFNRIFVCYGKDGMPKKVPVSGPLR